MQGDYTYFYLYCLCGHSLVVLDAVQTQQLKPHRSRAVEGRETSSVYKFKCGFSGWLH